MKFLSMLAVAVNPALAEEPTTSPVDLCRTVGDLAQVTIEAYYAGVPLSQILANEEQTELGRILAMDAYDEPRYSSEEVIAKAVFDFRTFWEHECFQSIAN
jgi:hypothetical protein